MGGVGGEAGVAGGGCPVPSQPCEEGVGGIEAGLLWLPEVLWALLYLICHACIREDLLGADSGAPEIPVL